MLTYGSLFSGIGGLDLGLDRAGLNCIWQVEIDFQNYIITPLKHHLAKPTALLIDDCDDNINQWKAAGGQAILFPQPWNSAVGTWEDVIKQLETLFLEKIYNND